MEQNDPGKVRKPATWISIFLLALILALIGLAIFLLQSRHLIPQDTATQTQSPSVTFDPLNAIYSIDGESIALIGGKSTVAAAPGSAEKIVTQIFGQPTTGDINGDGKDDVAVILAQTTGGSGTFYYAAAALNTDHGAMGTNAIFLGDRIAPETIDVTHGIITVNYADRKTSEPMSAQPSVGVSKYLVLGNSTLYDIPVNDIYPLSPGVTWGEKRMTTIMPGEQNVANPLVGIGIESQPITNITDIATTSLPFENYYKKKLAAAGWVTDNTLAAGGPGSEIVGYKKGTDYIILEYTSVFENKGSDSPETCPCDITLSLFVGSMEQ